MNLKKPPRLANPLKLLVGRLYEMFTRVSCFCCPYSRISELRNLYKHYPELWNKMIKMDNGNNWIFKNNKTIHEWNRKFKKETKNKLGLI